MHFFLLMLRESFRTVTYPVSRIGESVALYILCLMCTQRILFYCSGQSLLPYCDILGRENLDKQSCSADWTTVNYCNLWKGPKLLDAKYQVRFKIRFGLIFVLLTKNVMTVTEMPSFMTPDSQDMLTCVSSQLYA